MKNYFIELTRVSDNKKININAKMIGSISEEKKDNYKAYTRVGHLTHNNGGFEVSESAAEIFELIEKLGTKV